jgi:hypothetical protein
MAHKVTDQLVLRVSGVQAKSPDQTPGTDVVGEGRQSGVADTEKL